MASGFLFILVAAFPATRGKGYGQLIGLDMDLRIRPAVQAKKYMGIYVLETIKGLWL